MGQKICVNLGSGMDYRESDEKDKWVNIDKHPKVKADIHMDFIKDKLPFKDGSVDLVIIRNLLPHIEYKDMQRVVRESYRVLKNKGMIYVNAIHYSSRLGCEPAHVQSYSIKFLRQMMCDDISEKDYYDFIQERKIGKLFIIKRIGFKWINDEFVRLGTERWSILRRVINKVISNLGTKYPYSCDRVWCYWVGGFDLIEGEFIKLEESR